jgi:hypothetical protein
MYDPHRTFFYLRDLSWGTTDDWNPYRALTRTDTPDISPVKLTPSTSSVHGSIAISWTLTSFSVS